MEDRYNVECCEFIHAHDEIVEKVQKEMPSEDTLYDLTELFRIFGDSTRIRILYVLFEAEMCVCDIAALLGMTQSAISHQLKALKNARLVKSRREGKTVFYALADDHVKTIIDQGLEHILDLDCANCAAKMEEAIKKIDGVNGATVSFMTQKLTLDADDARFDEILQEVISTAKRIEPDCELYQ